MEVFTDDTKMAAIIGGCFIVVTAIVSYSVIIIETLG